MTSLRRARHSSAVRAVACALIGSLLFALVPLDARAAIQPPASAPNRFSGVSAVAFGEPSDIAATVSRSGRKVLLGVTEVALWPSILAKSAFGELLAHTGTDPQPYAFTGEPYDPNIGWQYHRARWMDARVGRFAGMDPWVGYEDDPPTLHRYLHVGVNPVNMVDPTGLEGEGGVAGQLTALTFSVGMAVLNNPAAMAAIGLVGAALLPEEVNNAMLMSGLPGLEVLGETGVAEARAIKLIKNAASERFAARELGAISNRAGHAFEDFAWRYLFKDAQRRIFTAGRRFADMQWQGLLIELKTSRILDARSRDQLLEFAKFSKDESLRLAYVFLNKPTETTIKLIKNAGGAVLYLFE